MIEAHSIEEFKKIMENLDVLSESRFPPERKNVSFWDTAIKIDGDIENYIHSIGGCSFLELQDKISKIRDEANGKSGNS